MKLDNFPTLKRLRALFCSNNQISGIDDDISVKLPSLEMLILSGNKVASLDCLKCLASAKSLLHLSLIDNPITRESNYRLKLISMLPNLRSLDFQHVSVGERNLSMNIPEDDLTAGRPGPRSISARSRGLPHMQSAIEQASTLEEVENLRRTLQSQRRGAN